MKATSGQKIKTGVFALAGLTLLVAAIFQIGKTKNLFGDTFHVYSTFKNVGGLQVGNNVRFTGVNVGTVESIQIISDTLARVDMVMKESVHPFFKKDAMATIGSDGLMGDKLIVISATSASTELIKNGDKVASSNPADFSEIIARVQRIANNAEVITDGLAGISTQISQGKGSLGRLLYNDKLAKNLEGTVSSIKEGTQGFSDNMKALKGNFLLRGYYKRKERKKQEKEQQQEQREKEQKPDTKNTKKDK